MTHGEKIAWIWVWSALTVVSLSAAFLTWRFWALPYLYLEARLCQTANDDSAARACEQVLSHDQTPDDLRLRIQRRALAIADEKKDYRAVIKQVTSLNELEDATAEDFNLRGLAYYALGDYENAAKDFAHAAQMSQAAGTYWSNLADAQIELSKYKEAFDNYTTAIKNGGDTADVLGNRGWASYQLGDYEKALDDYNQAVAKDGRHADNLNERGLVRHALGEYESAVSDYDRSLELKPDDPVILTNRGAAFARIGKNEDARRDFDKAIARDPKYESARIEKTWLLIDSDQYETALVELQALEKNGSLSVPALEARGRAHQGLGDWQETIADADRALALGTTFDWPYEYRAKGKRALGDYEGSITDITILITRNPKDIGPLASRALTLALAGRTQAALGDMSRAIAEKNNPAYAYEIRSYIHLRSGEITDAIADARQSVALSPQSSNSAATLGWALLQNRELAAAIRECSRSLTIAVSADAYACRALAQLAVQKTEAASEDVRLALGLDGRSGTALMASGRVDLAQGRVARAMERFNQALKFDIYNRVELFMYRGDAERTLNDISEARRSYELARKFDRGLYGKALDERMAALPSQ